MVTRRTPGARDGEKSPPGRPHPRQRGGPRPEDRDFPRTR